MKDINNISHVLASSQKTAYRGIVHDGYLDVLPDNHWIECLTTGLKNDSVFSMVIKSNQEIIGTTILSNIEKSMKSI